MLDREEDVRLAKNFTLNELVKSSTADRMGIDNWPEDDTHLVNITYVANRCIKQEYQRLFLKINPVFPALKTN